MPYQDVLDQDGAVVEAGYRSCEDRYQVIRQAVAGLRRPFTVLDVGGLSGYFSIRLTEEFGARCVVVDRDPQVQAAQGRVAAVVQQNVNAEALRKLGTYDVVLGLSVLHHMRDWRDVFCMMRRIARSALIVETPNPKEALKVAVARHELGDIESRLVRSGMYRIGSSPGVWDGDLQRGIFAMTRPGGIPVEGRIFSGSGNNGVFTARSRDELAAVLGYLPHPGSLNVRTRFAFRLGAHPMEFVDEKRGKGGKKGGDYQIWHASVEGYDGPAHVMRPGIRGHGRYVLEVWAPVKLRDTLGLDDGGLVRLKVGA